jgi:hypothetical protein
MHLEFVRDKARSFPSVADADEVQTLRVWHCKFLTLDPIARFANLRGLEIATYPDDSLVVIGELRMVQYLRVLHMPRVRDLSPLAQLESLVTLRLDTLPSWDNSGKGTTVQSLGPLAHLQALEHLELFGVVPADGSLEPLLSCRSLKTARFHLIPQPEVERYYALSHVANGYSPPPDF